MTEVLRAASIEEVHVDADRIRVGTKRLATRDIACVYVQPDSTAMTVRGVDAVGSLVFEVPVGTAEDAYAFMRRLRREPARERMIGYVRGAITQKDLGGVLVVLFGIALVLAGVIADVHADRFALTIYGVLFGLVLIPTFAFKARKVEVGHEGVLVQWYGEPRFVGYDEIDHVEDVRRGIALVLHRGERILLQSVRHRDIAPSLANEALKFRIEEGIRMRTVSANELMTRMRREGLSLEDWRTRLSELREGSYRVPAPSDEALWEVLEHPYANEDVRAAAAYLLKSSNPEASERIREAAHTVESPRLRFALESVANDDEDALEPIGDLRAL